MVTNVDSQTTRKSGPSKPTDLNKKPKIGYEMFEDTKAHND